MAGLLEASIPPAGTGVSIVRGEAGAVENRAIVRVTNVDATARAGGAVVLESTTASSAGAFQVSIPAQMGDQLLVVAIDASGNESAGTSLRSGPPISTVQLRIVGGNGQAGVVGRSLTDPIIVKATAGELVIPGLAVLFEPVAGGGRVAQTKAVTDLNGNAQTSLTLGDAEGPNRVAARLEAASAIEVLVDAEAVGTPRIDAISPAGARPDSLVTIQGDNFSPIPQHNEVHFGGEEATATASTATSIMVPVPTFASSGPVTVELTGVPSNALDYTVSPALVTGSELGSVTLQTLAGGDGTIRLPFEDGSQAFTVIVESVDPGANFFTTRVTGGAATGVSGRALGAAAARPAPIAGESFIRQAERRLLAALPRGLPPPARRGLRPAQDLGSTRTFNVVNTSEAVSPTDRDAFDEVTAVLRYVGQHTLLYVDDRTPAANLSDALIRQIGDRFDDQTYDIDVDAFGQPSDIDGNGKVIILLSPTVNGLTTPEIFAGGARIVGFFFGIDLIPHPTLNPFANEGEVMYAVIPDPDARFGSARVTTSEAFDLLSAVFAHEFEHMISFNQHVLVRDGNFEALWLDEALAHMAESLNGFHNENRLRSAFFLHRPSSTTLTGGGDALDERGAGWLFVQYLVDRFGEDVLGRLVQTNLTSTVNVDFAADRSFVSLFHEWAATLLLDGTGLSSDPVFDLPSVNLRPDFESAKQDINDPGVPPRITGTYLDIAEVDELPGAALQITQKGGSPTYLEFTARGRANAAISIDGAAGSNLQVTIVRTR